MQEINKDDVEEVSGGIRLPDQGFPLPNPFPCPGPNPDPFPGPSDPWV